MYTSLSLSLSQSLCPCLCFSLSLSLSLGRIGARRLRQGQRVLHLVCVLEKLINRERKPERERGGERLRERFGVGGLR
jgi:hypothetical protein